MASKIIYTDKVFQKNLLENDSGLTCLGHLWHLDSKKQCWLIDRLTQGILKGKYHCTIDLLFDLFGLVFLQIKTKIVSCHTADSTPDKQEVNRTMILPPLVFPSSLLSFVYSFGWVVCQCC